jgi:hypothetical protein
MSLGRWGVLIKICTVFLVCAPTMGQSQPSQNGIANSLPSTNFSPDGTVDRTGLPRPAPGFANAHVALNPQVPGAKAIGEKTCIPCPVSSGHLSLMVNGAQLPGERPGDAYGVI